MTEAERAVVVRVRGRVQGVGFRAFTQHESVTRGIKGWVVNRSDGSVEAALQGRGPDLSDLVALLRKGPTGARVEAVDVQSTDRTKIADVPDGGYAF